MVKLEQRKRWIFHITHFRNLLGIIESGGLKSDSEIRGQSVQIGYGHIKNRRLEKNIPSLNTFVGNCVPFYFGVRSPMLYVITKKNFDLDYTGKAREIVYLVADIQNIVQSNLQWCFSDENASSITAEFYTEIDKLDVLDWDAIETDRWGKGFQPDHPDLKEKKQAEFLVRDFFPWNLVCKIAVHDEEMKHFVQEILQSSEFQPPLSIQKRWYYD